MTAPTSLIYRIQSHVPEFATGVLADGTQVLLVQSSDSLIVRLLFSPAGYLLSAKELVANLQVMTGAHSSMTRDCDDLRMRPESIAVVAFCVPAFGIGIRSRPDIFEEFLKDPKGREPNERYRAETYQQIQEWNAEHRFVLRTWGKDYWMAADGSVFAT
jgi:hypothetical protein